MPGLAGSLSHFEETLECPISKTWLTKAVSIKTCGHIFNAEALIQHLKEYGRCPSCRGKAVVADVVKAPSMIAAVQAWLAARAEMEALRILAPLSSESPAPVSAPPPAASAAYFTASGSASGLSQLGAASAAAAPGHRTGNVLTKPIPRLFDTAMKLPKLRKKLDDLGVPSHGTRADLVNRYTACCTFTEAEFKQDRTELPMAEVIANVLAREQSKESDAALAAQARQAAQCVARRGDPEETAAAAAVGQKRARHCMPIAPSPMANAVTAAFADLRKQLKARMKQSGTWMPTADRSNPKTLAPGLRASAAPASQPVHEHSAPAAPPLGAGSFTAAAAAAAGPSGWTQLWSVRYGCPYYYNESTGHGTWQAPGSVFGVPGHSSDSVAPAAAPRSSELDSPASPPAQRACTHGELEGPADAVPTQHKQAVLPDTQYTSSAPPAAAAAAAAAAAPPPPHELNASKGSHVVDLTQLSQDSCELARVLPASDPDVKSWICPMCTFVHNGSDYRKRHCRVCGERAPPKSPKRLTRATQSRLFTRRR